jgi:hypothetical protein
MRGIYLQFKFKRRTGLENWNSNLNGLDLFKIQIHFSHIHTFAEDILTVKHNKNDTEKEIKQHR